MIEGSLNTFNGLYFILEEVGIHRNLIILEYNYLFPDLDFTRHSFILITLTTFFLKLNLIYQYATQESFFHSVKFKLNRANILLYLTKKFT